MSIYTDSMGNEFELPKLTTKLDEQVNAAANSGSLKAKYAMLLELLPAEYVSERLDGDSFDTIDVSELRKLFVEVKSAYDMPTIEANIEQALGMLDKVQPLLELAEQLDAGNQQLKRRGFNRVK